MLSFGNWYIAMPKGRATSEIAQLHESTIPIPTASHQVLSWVSVICHNKRILTIINQILIFHIRNTDPKFLLGPKLSQASELPARSLGCLSPRQSRVLPCLPHGESGHGRKESCPPQLCSSGRLGHLHCSPWSMGLRPHSVAYHFPYSHWSSLEKTKPNKPKQGVWVDWAA